MSEHIYSIDIGGEISQKNYDDITNLISDAGLSVDIPVYGQDDMHLRPKDNYWGEGDICELTDYLQENDLPYRIEGYATTSDSYYVEWWRPGMKHPDSVDTNGDWEEPDDNVRIMDVIDSLDDAKFTKENLKAAIAKLELKSNIPIVTWLEK